jgi:hypothetical protein
MSSSNFVNAFRPIDYISRAEACEILGFSRSKLQRMEKQKFFIKEISAPTPILRKHRFAENRKEAFYELAQIKELQELVKRQQAALMRRKELYGV